MTFVDMSQWSITRRIKTISWSLMIALALVGVLGIFATLRMSGLFTTYELASKQLLLATDVSEDAFEAELAERAYRTKPSQANIDEFRSNVAEVRAEGEEFEHLFAGSPDHLELSRALIRDLDAYEAGFDQILAHQAERNASVARMVAAGPAVQDTANGLLSVMIFDSNERAKTNLRTLIEEILQSQVYAERFLQTNAEADRIAAETHYKSASNAMDNVVSALEGGPREEAARKAKADLDTFWEAIGTATGAIRERNAIRDGLDELGGKIKHDIELIVDAVQTDQAVLAAQIQRTKTILSVVLVVFSVLAQVGSWLIARHIANDTRETIGRSIGEMQALSGGNLELEITGTKANHELGDMARALVVFRDNALETKALEAQQRQQEEEAKRHEAEEAERRKAEEAEAAARVEAARKKMLAELKTSVGGVVDAGAKGDFTRRIEARFDEPELAEMAQSINRLVENVEVGVAEVAHVMKDLASGDLSVRMNGEFHGVFATLQGNVNETFDRLASLVSQISGQCDEVSDAAVSMSEQSGEIARRAEQQAASLEETSAAMEEISASARSSAEGASAAAQIAAGASESVEKAGSVVTSAVSAMGDIRDASSRITEIVGVIDGIAFQTNLLALNAGVEAARAGDAGRGFAVVATEVRALAQRSSEASKDIKALIEESAQQVGRGVELVEETGKTLETIMSGVSEMAETMQRLTTTAQEQATGVGEVTTAITQLDVITQKNAALSEQNRTAASNVGTQAGAMRKLVGWFRTDGKGSGRDRKEQAA